MLQKAGILAQLESELVAQYAYGAHAEHSDGMSEQLGGEDGGSTAVAQMT